jgi:hypothetical protein
MKNLSDEKRRNFDQRLKWLLVAFFIFTGVAGFLMMVHQLAHLHWFWRGLLSLIYVGACELFAGLMLYGMKNVFSTIKEIALAVASLLLMIVIISINVVCHFRAAVFGQENNPVLMEWLTWGAALVPVFGLIVGTVLVLVSPAISKMRAERRRDGKQLEWSLAAQTDAYDTEQMTAARKIVSEMTAKAEAMRTLESLRADLPESLHAEFDKRVAEQFGQHPKPRAIPMVGNGRDIWSSESGN